MRPLARPLMLACLIAGSSMLQGCVIGAAVGATAAVVGGAAKVTGSVIGAGVDAVTTSDAETKAKAAEMSMMTAQQEQDFEDSVFDMTKNPEQPVVVDEVLELGVVMSDDSIVVRVAEDIENMTYGHGNNYTFRAGGKYQVPRAVGERLAELGLLYERL